MEHPNGSGVNSPITCSLRLFRYTTKTIVLGMSNSACHPESPSAPKLACVQTGPNFNETLTNDVVSFEQPGPGVYLFASMDNKASSKKGSTLEGKNLSQRSKFFQ